MCCLPLIYPIALPGQLWTPLWLRRSQVLSQNLSDLRCIILEDALLKQVSRYRQGLEDNEAGGVLLGSRATHELRVELATEPGGDDRARHRSFERCPRRAQTLINEAWQKSEGRCNYLGEWHTHPEAHPKPSMQDRKMIRQMFRQAKPCPEVLLLLIVGTKTVWLGQQTSSKLVHLLPR